VTNPGAPSRTSPSTLTGGDADATVPRALRDSLAGRYTVERQLGRGGMATVYLARDLKHDRPVAIKVMHAELANSIGTDRFLREISISSRLQHPHILTLIDSGEATDEATGERFLYHVMPYVQGESLRDRIAHGGALPPRDAVRLLREVVDAVSEAHRVGIIHRDLKPENVMIDAGGHALVVDFGIAKAMSDARDSISLTGTGISVGSPAYMAPEQALGEASVDHRADIYALGALAYEMLTGVAPFTGTLREVLAAHISMSPKPLRELKSDIPAPLERVVLRCLEKDPKARFQTATELLAELDAAATSSVAPVSSGTRYVMLAVGMLAVFVATYAALAIRRANRERWVVDTGIPAIQRLIDAGNNDSAFVVYQHARDLAPNTAGLTGLLSRFAQRDTFVTVPPDALVERATFNDTTRWEVLGSTPLRNVLVPFAVDRYRITKAGYRTMLLLSGAIPSINSPPLPDTIRLDAVDAPNPEMVHIPKGRQVGELLQLRSLRPLVLAEFLADRLETTNADYKKFVDAGGYAKKEYWDEAFLKDGASLTWEQAMALFVDRTGRPGPATWEGGDIPRGADQLPVGGLSWYEAAAYAKFAGKSLPTLYHWVRAAGMSASASMVRGSRFDAESPARGGAFLSMGPWGLFDAAGNVREWCSNLDGLGKHYLLGGGYNDSPYRFTDATALPAFDRSPSNGVRLVKYLTKDDALAQASRPIVGSFRDYSKEKPPLDGTVAAYRRFYDYDHTPLNARVDEVDSSGAEWRRELVSVDGAYGERLRLRLYKPRRATGRLQTVVIFPGSDAFSGSKADDHYAELHDFIVKNGRALVLPIYKSTYERNDKLASNSPDTSIAYRDHVLMWAKDLRRTIDYLSTRPDIDSTKFAYFGLSWGARLGPLMVDVDPRFKTAVLSAGGLSMDRSRPEVDPFNFLAQVRMPVLMLNGRNDQVFPVETSQKPMFDLLGTPAEQKRHPLYEGGHFVPHAALITEMLGWLDRYLGKP
jgi:dienelactone hydrolase/tRNA A-37 threonylcarbamoyl transferase component Bud32